jgi:uncharacterized protein (DUF58 family)
VVSFRGLLLSTGAAALAVLGLGFGVEEFVMLAIGLGVLLVLGVISVSWRARVARRSLHLELHVPAMEVSVGQPATMELQITNSGRHTIASVRIEVPARHWTVSYPGLGARHATMPAVSPPGPGSSNPVVTLARTLAWSVPIADLRRRTDTTVRIPVPTAVRGVVTLNPVGIWCEDPFRLLALRAAEGPSAHMIVCPVPDLTQVARIPNQTVISGRPSDPRPGAAPSASVAGDDLSSLRPYVPGDHLNRLHWPALARTGELVVRDFTAPESGRLALLVDLRPSAHGASSFESAIDRVAALGSRALADGVALELCTSAGERLEIPVGLSSRQALMRALALLGPTNPPTSSALRWTGHTSGSAVWAAAGVGEENMVLVTTDAGASSALPEVLQRRASVEVVR